MTSPIEDGLTVFRLPRSHWHCGFSGFEWGSVHPASLKGHIAMFVENVLAGGAPHLLLLGTPGIGKTHLGVAVYRRLAATLGTALVTWLNVPQFIGAVKQGYGNGVDPWPDVQDARRLVVLDDLLGKELSEHDKKQIVMPLLDTAYLNNASVLATANQSVEDLQVVLPSHEISRLFAGATVIAMRSDKDWRV